MDGERQGVASVVTETTKISRRQKTHILQPAFIILKISRGYAHLYEVLCRSVGGVETWE